jgi:hypothetical protein
MSNNICLTIRLQVQDFYEVIVDEGEAQLKQNIAQKH